MSDFDGTLADIVPDPAVAVPLPGVVEAIGTLARRCAVVAVVSGRPAPFLARHLGAAGPALRLFGGYGLEWMEGGRLVRTPAIEPWTAALDQVRAALHAQAPAALGVEDKGFAVTLHWREHPETGPWAIAFADEVARRHRLARQAGRMAVEIRPPLEIDKGTVVERLAQRCAAACFIGDDAGDLAAFDALDRLAARGVRCVRVAVADSESPPALLERADVVVDGPPHAAALLAELASA